MEQEWQLVFTEHYKENLISDSIEVYPKSGETLYLGMNERTITFKGEVKNTFNTEWNI